MTQSNKFEDLNSRFASLWTGMTQRYKFRDRQASSDCSIRISTASSAAASAPASNRQLATGPFTQRGAREGRTHERHHLVESGQRRRGDRGAGVLGADRVEEGPQHGGGGEDEAAQRLEGGDERVVRRGVVGYGARVAEAAAHDGQHGAGLSGYRAGEAGIPRGGGGGRI
uniref:Uncharacterized protein n=1 Tax=Oryza sativa subsp. japonica TaxID=39947 RepID=Q10GU7_ORYSJ|nr:hypothetical protein LOC_Os03g41674 [Oryza sativa Japonica Group]